MSSSFISNRVQLKVELCKCLRRNRVVLSEIGKRVVVMLLCCVVMLEQDVEHLQLQSCSIEGRVV